MFRKMRRSGQELSRESCIEILNTEPRGVLAVHGEDGYPYAVPMDYIYIDGALYFHCAREGHKLDAIAADGRVSFCVMDKGCRRDGDWALNISSVIVFGQISKLQDKEKARQILCLLGQRYYPTPESVEELAQKALDRVQLLELKIEHITGKLVHEA